MNLNDDQFRELGQQNRYRPQYSSWQQGMTNPAKTLLDTLGSGAATKRSLRNEAKKRFLFGSIDSAISDQSTIDAANTMGEGFDIAQNIIDPDGNNPSKRISAINFKAKNISMHGAPTYVPTTKKKNKGRGKGNGDMPPVPPKPPTPAGAGS